MKSAFEVLWLRLILFVLAIGVVTIVAVYIAQHASNRQLEDSRVMTMAARQTVLTQRVAKLAYRIQVETKENAIVQWRIDSLQAVSTALRTQHFELLNRINTINNSRETDSLLRSITPLIESSCSAALMITKDPKSGLVDEAAKVIEGNDQMLIKATERIILSYRVHAESKLSDMKFLLGVLGVLSFVFIVIAIIGILYPTAKNLGKSNNKLRMINEELQSSYRELQTAEEETRRNMAHIQSLQGHLENQEKQYRELVENAGDLIYEIDEKGRCLYVNPSMERLTGYAREEIMGRPYWEFIHRDHRDRVKDLYKAAVKLKRDPGYVEFPIVSKSESQIWIGQNTHFNIDPNGWVGRASIIARDITQLKATQSQLEESERMYRIISTNSGDLISLWDSTGPEPIRTFVSLSAKKILGYEPAELIGKSAFGFLHPDDVVRVKSDNYLKSKRGEEVFTEYRHRTKSGDYLWMESYTMPFYNDKGVQIGFQSSARDITRKKETERKLIEAKEHAEQATLAKSQFLSMMSHEIRTPMNGVIGLTNFLLEKNPREDQERHLKLLKFSGENLLVIINDILDFSKIEAGKINLEIIPFELKSFVENVVFTLETRASDKGILLTLEYDESLPHGVKADPVRVHQILNNLLGNAIKFTSKGSVHLSVEHVDNAGAMHNIRFTIRDSGVGIHQDHIRIIFEPFSQGSVDTTRKFGGTGLGLAITKRLLELMDTDISVKSVMGKGSTFTFALSLEEAIIDDAYDDVRPSDFKADKELHVLLVEDNDVNQIVATNYLELWKFHVTIASNGVEALKLIQNRSFNLVLMDIQMPGMNGFDCTRQIRELPDGYFKKVPIIALTASATGEDLLKLGAIGLNDYITKPFQPLELQEKIFRHLLLDIPNKGEKSAPGKLNHFSDANPSTNVVLAERMIGNLKFLQQAIDMSVAENNHEIFRRAYHQVKTTVSILADETFSESLEELKETLQEKAGKEKVEGEVESFKENCEVKITELSTFIMQMKL